MKYYEILKKKRQNKNLSLRDLGKMIGKTHSLISDVEKGNVKRKETIEKIMDVLEFTDEERSLILRGMAEEHYFTKLMKYDEPEDIKESKESKKLDFSS